MQCDSGVYEHPSLYIHKVLSTYERLHSAAAASSRPGAASASSAQISAYLLTRRAAAAFFLVAASPSVGAGSLNFEEEREGYAFLKEPSYDILGSGPTSTYLRTAGTPR